ncbi:UDP-N-acetylmuramyl pentapeptide synthase [Microbacterium paludicola]|uniref:UDP-N-acetylmuramyl pentapeptide synthase n=1 Tax=Microbacterium paludicola TaxID=300019 RepID=A0ABU1HWY8_9MICO|nr:UDP-N-acetylmuramyl pentapeptide synthase [Microbacterium paludicola]
MISLPLSDIARVLSGTLHVAGGDSPDTRVGGTVDTDSRNIGPGDVFVAKPGEATDGHLFVPAAAEAGAALAIVEHLVDADITQIVVADAGDGTGRPRSRGGRTRARDG